MANAKTFSASFVPLNVLYYFQITLDPSGRDDSILEKLENCDPTVDPECKRNLEDVSEQLLEQLESDKKKDSNGESTDSHIEKEANISQSGSKLEHSAKENERSVDLGSKEPTSKNQPVKKHKDVSSDDVPDVYFLGKFNFLYFWLV